MRTLWLGSLMLTLGFAATAGAKGLGKPLAFKCEFNNAKGEPTLVLIQAGDDGAADIVVTKPQTAQEPVESTPAWYEIDGTKILITVDVDVTRRRDGSSLASRRKEPVVAFTLKWIKGENSKKWALLTKEPLVAKLPKPPVCNEVE